MRPSVPESVPPRPSGPAETLRWLGQLTYGGFRWAYRYLVGAVSIDTRTLALFRIAVALIIITEVSLRSRNLVFFYTDDGVVPREYAQELTHDWAFSIYFYVSDPTWVGLLFVVQIIIAGFLLVGYRTRAAMVLSFLFMVSLDHSNPFITSYADTLLRLLLFWAIFLPLGERWSIDALHADGKPRKTFASPITLLIMGQMVYMYFRNGIHKYNGRNWWDGTATPLILARDDITFLLGEYTHLFTPPLEFGTYLWAAMMLVSPLLILLRGRYRYPAIVLFMGGHFTFALTVRIGMFPYVAIAGLILFVQSEFWYDSKRLLARLGVDHEGMYHGLTTGRAGTLAAKTPNFEFTTETVREPIYVFFVAVVIISVVLLATFNGLQLLGVVGDDLGHDEQIEDAASVFNVDQPDFSIFAPNPGTNDRWYIFPARTESGEIVDVYNERPMTWDRPGDQLQHQYDGYRERFYMNSIRRGTGDLRLFLAEYLCDNWVSEDGEGLTHVNMWVIRESIDFDSLNDPDERDIYRSRLYTHGCDGNDPVTQLAPSPGEA